jgi:hypothetical protein
MRENKPISSRKKTRFVKIYNGTKHRTNGVSPAQMQDKKDLEVQYIIESINKQNKIETTTPNYKLNINDK